MSTNFDSLFAEMTSTAGAPTSSGRRALKPRDKILDIARRSDIPDDIAEDFIGVTGLESGHSHTDSRGRVRESAPDPKSGERAVGFSQIKPSTIAKYKLDPYDEDQNIEGGLRYFAEGGDDPVARRLHYFGGPRARRFYQRTGRIPKGQDANGVTFDDYIKRTRSGPAKPSKAGQPNYDELFDEMGQTAAAATDVQDPTTAPAPGGTPAQERGQPPPPQPHPLEKLLNEVDSQPNAPDAEGQTAPVRDVQAERGFTETLGLVKSEYARNQKMLRMPGTSRQAKAKIVQELSRRVYEKMAENSNSDPGAEVESQLQGIFQRVSETGQIDETALRRVWESSLANTSSGLPQTPASGVAVSDVPRETSQRFTGSYGDILDHGPDAESAYLDFVRRNAVTPQNGKPLPVEQAAKDETLAGTFLRIQNFMAANPKASVRQQSRYLADLGIEFLKTPETDGKLLPKILHTALLDGHLSKQEIAELPANLQKQIRQRQFQIQQARQNQQRARAQNAERSTKIEGARQQMIDLIEGTAQHADETLANKLRGDADKIRKASPNQIIEYAKKWGLPEAGNGSFSMDGGREKRGGFAFHNPTIAEQMPVSPYHSSFGDVHMAEGEIDREQAAKNERLHREMLDKVISQSGGQENLNRVAADEAFIARLHGRPAKDIPGVIEKHVQANIADFKEREQRVIAAETGRAPKLGVWDKIRELGDHPAQLIPFISSAPEINKLLKVSVAAERLENLEKQNAGTMKFGEGGLPTEEDRLVLREFLAESQRDSTFLYKVSDVVSALPAFIGEFALTGGVYSAAKKGALKGIEHLAEKEGIKRIEKFVVGRVAKKELASRAVAGIARLTKNTAAGMIGAIPQSIVTGTTRIPAGVMYREMKGDDFGSALGNAIADQYIEVATERAGGLLDHIPLPKRLSAIRDALTARWMTKAPGRSMEQLKKIVERTGWNGVLGEMFEERVGDVAHYAIGQQDSPFPSVEQLLVEGLSFSIPGLATAAAGKAVQIRDRERAISSIRSDFGVNHKEAGQIFDEVRAMMKAAAEKQSKPEVPGGEIPNAQTIPSDQGVVPVEGQVAGEGKGAGGEDVHQKREGREPVVEGEVAPVGSKTESELPGGSEAATEVDSRPVPFKTKEEASTYLNTLSKPEFKKYSTAYNAENPSEEDWVDFVNRFTGRDAAEPAAKSPKDVIEAAGYVYKGQQERPKGKTPLQLFDTSDGSTLAIEGEVTPETIAAKIAEYEAKKVKAPPKAEAATPRDRVRSMMTRWESEEIKTVDDLIKEAKTHASEPAVAKAIERYESDTARFPDDMDRHGDRLLDDLHRASALPLKSGALPNENGVFDEKSPGIEIIKYEGGRGKKPDARPKADAKIRVAELADGSWVSTASQHHYQGNASSSSGPLSSTSQTFKTREDAIHNAAEEIVYRQEKQAVATDSGSTDNQRAEAKKMAEWARKVMADNPKATEKGLPKNPVSSESPKEATPPTGGTAETAEGLTLPEIKRRLPVGFDEESARIVDGKIMATEKPDYGGRQMWVSLKKATATPVVEQAKEAKSEETDTKAGKQPARDRTEQQRPIREPRPPKSPTIRGKETRVKVPGTDRGYDARYVIREADDVIPSHNPFNFQPNPDYHHVNDRRYDKEQQYQTQVMNRSSATGPEPFDPAYEINNSPTAENGPPVIDSDGNVLGGNSRAMIIKRVLEGENTAELQRSYRQMLFEQALGYGLDPGLVMAMKKPMLVREVDDAKLATNEGIQKAITELNVAGVTPLTHEEKSAAAASQISDSAAEFLTDMIESEGEDATIASVMDRKGVAIINRLIEDGIFTAGERNVLIKDGKPTAEAKARVEKILVSGIYRDLTQMESTPAGVRRNIERIVVPMRRIAGTDWDLAEPVRGAIDAITEARATGQDLDKVRNQQSMVREPYSDKEIALAKVLMMGPRKTADRFRAYAGDYQMEQSGGGLFGAPPRGESAGLNLGIESMKSGQEIDLDRRVFDLASPHHFTDDLLPLMRYEYRNGTFFVNPEAGEILRRTVGSIMGRRGAPVTGFHMNPGASDSVQSHLRLQAKNVRLTNREKFLDLAKSLKRASAQSQKEGGSGGLVVVTVDESSPMKTRGPIVHEGVHKTSFEASGGKSRATRVDVEGLKNIPAVQRVIAAVREHGYVAEDDAYAMEEGSAWLQTPRGRETLKVSDEDSDAFLAAYFKSFAEQNGSDAILKFRRIHSAARKVRDRVYQEISTDPSGAFGIERAEPSGVRDVHGTRERGLKTDDEKVSADRSGENEPERKLEGESEGSLADIDDSVNRDLAKDLPPTREQSFEKNFGVKPRPRAAKTSVSSSARKPAARPATVAATPEQLQKTIEQLNKFAQANAIRRRTGGLSSARDRGQFLHGENVNPEGEIRIRAKDVESAQDYMEVLSHEIGHSIEAHVTGGMGIDTFSVFGKDIDAPTRETLETELKAVTLALEGPAAVAKNRKYYDNPSELLARFFEKMITSPGDLEEIAPTATRLINEAQVVDPVIREFMEAADNAIDKGQSKTRFLPDLRDLHQNMLGKRVGDLAYGEIMNYRAMRARAATVLTKFVAEKFKGVKDSPESLFRAAEGIKVTRGDVPEFGTRDFANAANDKEAAQLALAGWEPLLDASGDAVMDVVDGIALPRYFKVRYTPEDAQEAFEALSPEGKELVSGFTAELEEAKDYFNREMMKDAHNIVSNVEGWVHHYFEERPTPAFSRATKLKERVAGSRKHREGEIGYIEDFRKAITKAMVELDTEKAYNEFINRYFSRVSKPIPDGALPDKGWVEVSGDMRKGITVPGESRIAVVIKDGKPFVPKKPRYQMPAVLYKHLQTIRNVSEEASLASRVISDINRYWRINVLFHPGTAMTNAISGGIQYSSKVLDDFYSELLSGNVDFPQTRRNVFSMLTVATPKGWQNAPDWIYGGDQSNFYGQFQGQGAMGKTIDSYANVTLKFFGAVERYWKKVVSTAERGQQLSSLNEMEREGLRLPTKEERALLAQMNEVVDLYAYDYDNVPAWLEAHQRSVVGQAIKPFAKYPYKYAKHVSGMVGNVFDRTLPWQSRLASLLALATLMGIYAAYHYAREDEVETPPGDAETPARISPRGRMFVGKDDEGKEVFVRTSKYPFFNITEAGIQLADGQYEAAKDVTSDMVGSIGPGGELAALLMFDMRNKYEAYTPIPVMLGDRAASFVPGARILSDVARMADPYQRKKETFAQSFTSLIPTTDPETQEKLRGSIRTVKIPVEGEIAKRPGDSRKGTTTEVQLTNNPRDILLSLLTGIYTTRIDPDVAKAVALRKEKNTEKAAKKEEKQERREKAHPKPIDLGPVRKKSSYRIGAKPTN